MPTDRPCLAGVSAKDNMGQGWALAAHELVEPRYWSQG
jgi:hypothetical protein